MASLSTCHLELVVWDGNLVKPFSPKYALVHVVGLAARILFMNDGHMICRQASCNGCSHESINLLCYFSII